MDIEEVVQLSDLDAFLDYWRLTMTLHGTCGEYIVTLTGGREPLTGRGRTVEAALKGAWSNR